MSSAAPGRGVPHTALLLLIQTGDADAVRFALDVLKTAALEMSELSAIGLLATAQDAAERDARFVFLHNSRAHRVTVRVSRMAFGPVSSLPVPSAITADDAVVAATAIEHSLPLFTLDPVRFAYVPGLAVIRPY